MADNKEAPAISILITAYNVADYIGETLESVLAQRTDYTYEILVGDDGSTDGTDAIIETYREKYPFLISLYRMPRKQGAFYHRVDRSAANRLNLLKYAQGRYVSFLDGDDYYISRDRLQRMTELLEREENADCILCAHNLLMVYPDGREVPLCRAKRERKITCAEYWQLMFLQSNALLFRNIYKEHLPKGALAAVYDDNNITYALLQQGKMYYLPECMGAYRQTPASSWNAIDLVKQSASNIIGYAVESEIAPQQRNLSDIRHYPDLRALYRHRRELSRKRLDPFYSTAERLGLAEAVRVYRMGRDGGAPLLEIRRRLFRGACGYYLAKGVRVCKKMLRRY